MDVDLDGVDELVFGSPGLELDGHSGGGEGKVFAVEGVRLSVARGGPTVFAEVEASSVVTAGERPVKFGLTIAETGDLDGDGAPGMHISGWSIDLPLPLGESNVDRLLQWRWVLPPNTANHSEQWSAPPCGDVDGDGADDYCHAFYGVHFGPMGFEESWETPPDIRLGGEYLHSARVDGSDRYTLIGGTDSANENRGAVWLDHPPITGEPEVWLYGESPGDKVGNWLSVGELTGDGVDDVVVASILRGGRDGQVWVWSDAHRSGPLADADMLIEGVEPGGALGFASVVADLDGDGQPDLALGNAGFPTTGTGVRGRVLVFRGPLQPGRYDETSADAVWVGSWGQGDRFGHALAAGDLDGDGVNELIVGAPGDAELEPAGGAVYVIWEALRD